MLDSAINRWDTELKESSENEWIPSTDYESNPMNRVMRLFYILASRQGLDLPSQMTDRNLLINPSDFMTSSVNGDETTNGAYLEIAAIAQHYGFPTLLLDWTLDPLCALYFAVKGSMDGLASRSKHYDIREGSFSIFALKASEFNQTKPEVHIRTYTHHSNRNLIAQRGLFTYVCRNSLDDRRTILDVVDGLEIRELHIDSGNLVEGEPVLIKLNIRYSEVIKAMDYLKQMFKTSDTFFPGYEGIVMAMKDHANYQIVKERLNSCRTARPR